MRTLRGELPEEVHRDVMELAYKIEVYGLVQGVGFRPFVAALAEELGLRGKVKNVGGRVEMTAAGESRAIEELLYRLRCFPPTGARVERVETESISPESVEAGFSIVESDAGEEPLRVLPADLATCPACEKELFDPKNRRFRHPFISCVACGPRYSILKKTPYDRATVTMDEFPMCAACASEYRSSGDRRRHAQTICCSDCGPVLRAITGIFQEGVYAGAEEVATGEEALQMAVRVIRSGRIVAAKDIGGFHFAFLPEDAPAKRLREFKAREAKPFAVCFRSLEEIREFCEVSEEEERLLTSPARPIVLLKKRVELPDEVLKGSDRIGAMLPCNPLQMLLLSETGALVMTSGNRGNEPIITHTAEMERLLASGMPDLILTHDREILSPLDDSIFQVTELTDGTSVTQVLRRARGIAPEPILLNLELKNEILADGSDLKAVFGLGKGRAVYLSPHFGDLSEHTCVVARERERSRMETLFSVKPRIRIGDLHPAYISAKGTDIRVQHHHAHILSVMAEHQLTEPVLGLAFDGTGYGTDGTIWGSECLLCTGSEFEKKGSLLPVELPGGDAGARRARLSLAGYRHAAGLPVNEPLLAAALEKRLNTVRSSSMGRLFDAASALLSVREENTYEGECAAALEIFAGRTKEAHPLTLPIVERDGLLYGDGAALIAEMSEALENGASAEALALGFHEAVANFGVALLSRVAEKTGVRALALSGGTFCNRILLKRMIPTLRERGFQVFLNEAVPCGDGGIALGQTYYEMLRERSLS